MAARADFAPFVYRDGRLCLEDVDLAELAAALDGRAAWVISHAAIAEAIARAGRAARAGGRHAGSSRAAASPPEARPTRSLQVDASSSEARCIDVAAIGPPAVLAQIAAAGWWARVRSSHELQLALTAGFPPERLVAGRGVRDDGFVKDALAASVAAMDHDDAGERANAARIAALLGHELPPEGGLPPDASVRLLACCGGLLAPVLRPAPALAVDAVLPALAPRSRSPAMILALRDGAVDDVSLAGLDARAASRSGRIRGWPARGDWVVIQRPDAAGVHAGDAAHAPPPMVLVRGTSWRLLECRPLPVGSG